MVDLTEQANADNSNKQTELEALKSNLKGIEENARAKTREINLMKSQMDERNELIQSLEAKVENLCTFRIQNL